MSTGTAAARCALRDAHSFALSEASVLSCLDTDERVDRLFARAFTRSLHALPVNDRGGTLAPTTGHVAESVVELELVEHGWTPVWHFRGGGRHGVDLLMLNPSGERLFALEVKGTLSPVRWPRLRRGDIEQMSRAWLDKADNPGMAEWSLDSGDVYGAIALVSFAIRAYKVAFSPDLRVWRPVQGVEQLENSAWLDGG